jgi:hypothetical protein
VSCEFAVDGREEWCDDFLQSCRSIMCITSQFHTRFLTIPPPLLLGSS